MYSSHLNYKELVVSMKKYNFQKSVSSAILVLSAFANFGYPQAQEIQGYQAIPLSQFNEGRPSNFYYLVDSTFSGCSILLESLNMPWDITNTGPSNEVYSKYLLSSSASIPWIELDAINRVTGLSEYKVKYAKIDIDNDDIQEEILIRTFVLSSLPTHYLAISSDTIFPDSPSTITEEINEQLNTGEARRASISLRNNMTRALMSSFEDYGLRNPNRLSISNDFFEVVSIAEHNYILLTSRDFLDRRIDVFAFKVGENEQVTPECRLTSKYQITR